MIKISKNTIKNIENLRGPDNYYYAYVLLCKLALQVEGVTLLSSCDSMHYDF